MGVSVGELEVNTKHINELTKQIKNTTDCDSLLLVVDEHLKAVRDLFDDIKEEQSKILSDILPLLTIPAPTPQEIVKWIKKLVTATATPQLRAMIKYTKKLIQLTQAILNIIGAIEEAIARAPQCFTQLKGQLVSEFQAEVDSLVDSALGQIAESQSAILAIVDIGNSIPRIDTSSVQGFIATVDNASIAIEQKVKEYSTSPLNA